jgi:hypothetical protein
MLLENPALREHCEASAFEYGKGMSWGNVGRQYADLFNSLVSAEPHASQDRMDTTVESVGKTEDELDAPAERVLTPSR